MRSKGLKVCLGNPRIVDRYFDGRYLSEFRERQSQRVFTWFSKLDAMSPRLRDFIETQAWVKLIALASADGLNRLPHSVAGAFTR
jgi:hypothetical protein